MKGTDRWWRGPIAGEGERCQVEGSDRRWREWCRRRGTVSGGEQSRVETAPTVGRDAKLQKKN